MSMVQYISSRCCGAPVPSMCTYSLQTAARAIRARCGYCSMPMVFYISSRCCGAPVPSVRVYSIQTAARAIRARCGYCSMSMVQYVSSGSLWCSYAICEGVQPTDRSARHPCPLWVLLHVDGAICQ